MYVSAELRCKMDLNFSITSPEKRYIFRAYNGKWNWNWHLQCHGTTDNNGTEKQKLKSHNEIYTQNRHIKYQGQISVTYYFCHNKYTHNKYQTYSLPYRKAVRKI